MYFVNYIKDKINILKMMCYVLFKSSIKKIFYSVADDVFNNIKDEIYNLVLVKYMLFKKQNKLTELKLFEKELKEEIIKILFKNVIKEV